jgi:DNA polymerase III subunit delta'
MSEQFLPWQQQLAVRWLERKDRLPHALLIHGLAGIGKRQFARALAASLLCEDTQNHLACGHCTACQWITAGSHPDLALVRPQAVAALEGAVIQDDEAAADSNPEPTASGKKKLSDEIKADDIRALEPWYHRATHRGGLRIVVLYPAQTLNVVSANALLKSLEEPPSNTLFLLVDDSPDRLLPTILSRCQKIPMAPPSARESAEWLIAQGVAEPSEWLAAAGGAPLRALEMSKQRPSPCPAWASNLMSQLSARRALDVGRLADELAGESAAQWLPILKQLSVDLCLASAGLKVRYFPGLEKQTTARAKLASLSKWTEIEQWLGEQIRLIHHPLNGKLFAHACLQRFCEDF